MGIMSHLRVPSSPLFDAAGKRHRLYLGLLASSRPSILSSSSMSAGAGQGRLSIVLALPLRGHTHPLLTEMIHELPYVPETVERVHNSDHRPPHRPLSSGEGDRSDLNKRVISHGCLQSSFLFTARRGRRQALEGPDREVVPPASSCLTHSREGPAFFVSAHPGQAPVPTTPESLDIREHSHLGRETIRETGKPVIPYVVAPPRDR